MKVQTAAGRRPVLLNRVIQTIREKNLFVPGRHLLVAISGGPDSVALLSLLVRLSRPWNLRLTGVHFNYGLRGSESDGDEAFVSMLCDKLQVPVIVKRPELVKRRRVSSVQALAREARYEAMKAIARQLGGDHIATGHTANDRAETVLIWMLRGTGLNGLTGMPFVRENLIVRPLLSTTRDEVLEYLKQEGLSYRQDSSNATGRYRRNQIRHEVLPVMAGISPKIVRLLARQADLLVEDEQYLEQVVSRLCDSLVSFDSSGVQRFNKIAFAGLPIALQRRLLRRLLKALHPEGVASSLQTVDSVRRFALKGGHEATLSLPHVELTRDREWIAFIRRTSEQRAIGSLTGVDEKVVFSPVAPVTIDWPGTGQEIHVQVTTLERAKALSGLPGKNYAVFDADLLSEPLMIRSWKNGDRFFPSGMNGKSKKLQDFFVDAKVGRRDRDRIPLLVAPEGVLWVVGWRSDERFRAGEGSSRYLLATVNSMSGSGGAE